MHDSGFNRIAPFYEGLAGLVFGQRLRKAQAAYLGLIPSQATILILGGGAGWLLRQVLDACDPQKVIYIDAAPTMIRLARQAVRADPRVDFRVGNETAIAPADTADVVMTPFLLDLFAESRLRNRLIPKLLSALRPGGLWLGTDFLPPKSPLQRGLLWAMYRFFRLTAGIEARRLPNWSGLLDEQPTLEPVVFCTASAGLLGSGCWKKLERLNPG